MKKFGCLLKKNGTKIANICLMLIFVLFFVLIMLFEYDIQFLANGFQKLAGKELQVYYLDVGQASANLVILPTGRTLLIDTGSSESEKEFLQSVDKILKQNSLSCIDILLLTHSDEDHVGGAVAIFDKYQVKSFYRPKVLSSSAYEVDVPQYKKVDSEVFSHVVTSAYKEKDCDVEFIENKIFVEGDCVVEIFSCKEDTYNDTNSYCPFVTVEYQSKIFMFCGDATKEREKEFVDDLTEEDRSVDVDFLLVSHHGAKSSTTEEFLSFIKPRYAIISAGDKLHPTQTVIDRLKKIGVEEIFCTKTDGMIGIGVQYSGAFETRTMDRFIDLPLILCIIFVIGAVWNFYFVQRKQGRKFSVLTEK